MSKKDTLDHSGIETATIHRQENTLGDDGKTVEHITENPKANLEALWERLGEFLQCKDKKPIGRKDKLDNSGIGKVTIHRQKSELDDDSKVVERVAENKAVNLVALWELLDELSGETDSEFDMLGDLDDEMGFGFDVQDDLDSETDIGFDAQWDKPEEAPDMEADALSGLVTKLNEERRDIAEYMEFFKATVEERFKTEPMPEILALLLKTEETTPLVFTEDDCNNENFGWMMTQHSLLQSLPQILIKIAFTNKKTNNTTSEVA